MANQTKTKKDHSKGWEIFHYSFWGTIWVTGAALGALGIYARNTDSVLNNPIYKAEQAMPEWLRSWAGDWRLFGALILAVATIALLIALFHYANKRDREKEVAQRRKERLAAMIADEGLSQSVPSVKAQETVPAKKAETK